MQRGDDAKKTNFERIRKTNLEYTMANNVCVYIYIIHNGIIRRQFKEQKK